MTSWRDNVLQLWQIQCYYLRLWAAWGRRPKPYHSSRLCNGAAMMKISELSKRCTEAQGTQIAEAAVVMPIMFMLLLGIYWFGRALNTYETINHAAMEAARVAALGTCATCSNPLVNTTVAGDAVQQALQAAALNPSSTAKIPGETLTACGSNPAPVCQDPSGSGGPSMCIYYNVALNTAGPQSCGVYVSFQYPYQFYLPFTPLNLQQVHLRARVQYPGEY